MWARGGPWKVYRQDHRDPDGNSTALLSTLVSRLAPNKNLQERPSVTTGISSNREKDRKVKITFS